MGVLIEHLAGAFPMWLAPEQVRLATVGDTFTPFAKELEKKLLAADIRVTTDDGAEKVGKKVRDAAMTKVPWTIVIGQKEVEGGDLQITIFGSEEKRVIAQSEIVDEVRKASSK
jgi:threonyl-tRNA synthetase